MNASEMLLESLSPFGFEKTTEKLSEVIARKEWRMPAVHDLQQTLRNAGKEVRPVKVFEICKPKFSGRILELDQERIASNLMPCRISVYERADGRTYISRLNTAVLGSAFGGVIEEVMGDSGKEIEEIIMSVLNDQ
jgi:uncharacterized protein (DUF302 family)